MKTLKTLAIALLSTISMAAQNDNVEAHVLNQEGKSRARINLFQELPGKVNNYTFIELKPSGYFLRNINSKEVYKGLGVRLDTKHSNSFTDHAGIGIDYKVPVDGMYMKFSAQPLWINACGEVLPQSILGGVVNKKFDVGKLTLDATVFGEYNLQSNQWMYGEANAHLGKKDGTFSIGLGVDLYNQQKALPKPSPKLMLKANF